MGSGELLEGWVRVRYLMRVDRYSIKHVNERVWQWLHPCIVQG